MTIEMTNMIRAYFESMGMAPGIRETEPDPDACPTCQGLGEVYFDADGLNGGLRPCPDCQCPVCGGRGVVRLALPVNHPQFGRLVRCPANCDAVQTAYHDHYHRLLTASRLPVEYQHLSFESFDALLPEQRRGKMAGYVAALHFARNQPHVVDQRAVAAQFGKDVPTDWRNWLVLWGEHGRGKTGLAAAVVNALLSRQEPVLYTRLQDAIKAIQSRYGRDEHSAPSADVYGDMSADEVLEMIKRAPVLVLDEFDEANAAKADKQSIVENIIRYRHGEILPTLITTNLGVSEMEVRWGTTTMSVIRQRAHWIEMSGVSLRPDVTMMNWG